jgi:hypothetical protein
MANISQMTDAELLLHAKGLKTFVVEHPEIDVEKVHFNDVYIKKLDRFEITYEANVDRVTRSHLTAKAKDAAREELEPEVRWLEMALKSNKSVSIESLISLNINLNRGGYRTPNEAPTDIVKHNIFVGIIRHILIYFGITGKKIILRGKPKGVYGAEVRWAILDHVPLNISELHESEFSTRSPFDFEFSEEDRGKIFYFCIRWENTTGKKGPWSEIFEVRIP